ncbi:restriction endonuclease subunit S, partial [Lactobacillus johnsonii]|uniref:restriction endonuclease subunit S n=1 Tax=Lactobacillus johnsonii TaxID=33959 RepID=UPI000ACA2CCF
MTQYSVAECFDDIRNGASIKQNKLKSGYPITRIETISNNKFNRDKVGYAGITDLSKYTDYILNDRDLLMSQINSMSYLGRTVLYQKQKNETIIHGMNLLRLQVKKEIVIPEYVELLFKSFLFKQSIRKIAKKSVNQASFSINDFKKIKLEIPSKNKQKDIILKFQNLQKLQVYYRNELKKLDELIKARFVEMFGDPGLNKKSYPVK